MEKEKWIKIEQKDFNVDFGKNEYYISNLGNVYNKTTNRMLKRCVNNGKCFVALATQKTYSSTQSFATYYNTKHFYIHVLLAYYLIEKYDTKKYEVLFKDNDKSNVSLDNIYISPKYSGDKELLRREKISNSNKGKTRTQKQRKNISVAKKKAMTQETKDKIRQSRLGKDNWNSKKVYQYSITDGKLIKTYDTCKIAEQENGFAKNTLAKKCRENAQFKGYIWSYK